MEAITQATIEEQKQQFQNQLDQIFSMPYGIKSSIDDNGLINKAKVNTTEQIDRKQIVLIEELAEDYKLNFQISRSGAGIKFQFNLIEDEVC